MKVCKEKKKSKNCKKKKKKKKKKEARIVCMFVLLFQTHVHYSHMLR